MVRFIAPPSEGLKLLTSNFTPTIADETAYEPLYSSPTLRITSRAVAVAVLNVALAPSEDFGWDRSLPPSLVLHYTIKRDHVKDRRSLP